LWTQAFYIDTEAPSIRHVSARRIPFSGYNFGMSSANLQVNITSPAEWSGLRCNIYIESGGSKAICDLSNYGAANPPPGNVTASAQRTDIAGSYIANFVLAILDDFPSSQRLLVFSHFYTVVLISILAPQIQSSQRPLPTGGRTVSFTATNLGSRCEDLDATALQPYTGVGAPPHNMTYICYFEPGTDCFKQIGLTATCQILTSMGFIPGPLMLVLTRGGLTTETKVVGQVVPRTWNWH